MNERIKELRRQATLVETYTANDGTVAEGKSVDLDKFAELLVRECVNAMLNTDEQKFVVETEGWELGGANHGAWERGILDAVATVKEHFGVEE